MVNKGGTIEVLWNVSSILRPTRTDRFLGKQGQWSHRPLPNGPFIYSSTLHSTPRSKASPRHTQFALSGRHTHHWCLQLGRPKYWEINLRGRRKLGFLSDHQSWNPLWGSWGREGGWAQVLWAPSWGEKEMDQGEFTHPHCPVDDQFEPSGCEGFGVERLSFSHLWFQGWELSVMAFCIQVSNPFLLHPIFWLILYLSLFCFCLHSWIL